MRKPFYGWIIVGVSFLIGVTEVGAFQSILSIFMKPMAQDFGWGRASVTGAIALGSIFGGVISPFVGPFLDRYGPRMVAFWGIFILSVGLAGMTFLSHIWQLYLFFGLGRMVAMGALSMVVSVSVSNWFVRERGRAMGIAWLGPQFGSALLPAMAQFLIIAQGWRMAWTSLGVVVFLMSGIPSLFFLRRRPEDVGLLPDGAETVSERNGKEDPLKEQGPSDSSACDAGPAWTLVRATHTRAFWMLTIMHSLIFFLQAGTNFHIFPFLTDHGVTEVTAVLFISTVAVFGMVGSVTWGVLAERFRIQSLLAVNMLGSGVVFLALYWVVISETPFLFGTKSIFVLGALHGFIYGGRMPLVSTLWAEFFGRHSLGSIYGFSSPFRLTANALGPIFAAICFDLFGSYVLPFYIFGAIYLITGVIGHNLNPPGIPQAGE